jgi:hypothetical protein
LRIAICETNAIGRCVPQVVHLTTNGNSDERLVLAYLIEIPAEKVPTPQKLAAQSLHNSNSIVKWPKKPQNKISSWRSASLALQNVTMFLH